MKAMDTSFHIKIYAWMIEQERQESLAVSVSSNSQPFSKKLVHSGGLMLVVKSLLTNFVAGASSLSKVLSPPYVMKATWLLWHALSKTQQFLKPSVIDYRFCFDVKNAIVRLVKEKIDQDSWALILELSILMMILCVIAPHAVTTFFT